VSKSQVLVGANIRVYLNGVAYNECQSVTYTLDTGDQELYGVDSMFPQEIVPVRSVVSGQISGIKTKNSGGLQARGIRAVLKDVLKLPYVSIRIQDRQTGEDILFIPKARVSSETFSAAVRQSVKVSFNFRGILALQPLDRQ
jgi:hypothetical protein